MNKKPNMNRRQILGLLGLGSTSLLHKNVHASPQNQPAIDWENSFPNFGLIVKDTLMEMLLDKQLKNGMVVHTLGYHEVGDGGGASYKLYPSEKNKDIQIGEWRLETNLLARLVGVQAVNYAMFGAKGNGMDDDGDQIKQAHDYANLHKLPVVNVTGEYWLKASQTIYIRTNVDWGLTVFHISEHANTKNTPRFIIASYQKPQDISWDNETKRKFLKQIKPDIQQFEEFASYKNTLIIVRDDNDRIGYRAGARYGGASWAKEEFFYVEEHGRIIGDIAWTFKDYTHLTAYPAEDCYLMVEGGSFYLSGEGAGQDVKGYRHNGFTITRSRTIIRNQWVGMEKDAVDTSMNPRTGFYNFSRVYDITLENIRLIPWEQDREGTERDVPAGTYGISGARVLKSCFNNIMAEGGAAHWGVFGTNLMKDLSINRCHLNRIDVHFHAWNIHIKDSKIGYRGISVTGGGELIVENTQSSSTSFINFRRDYGAKWDGYVQISNCRFIPPAGRMRAVLYFSPADFEYGYPIGLAHGIRVENLQIDLGEDTMMDPCWVLYAPSFSKTKNGHKLFFPRDMTFRNIRVRGGRKGVKVMKLTDPQHFFVRDSSNNDVYATSQILLEDVDLEYVDNTQELEMEANMQFVSHDPALVEEGLYLQLYIARCNRLAASFDAMKLDIDVRNSVIHALHTPVGGKLMGKITLWDCILRPDQRTRKSKAFTLDCKEGASFVNCRLSAPVVDGKPAIEALNLLGFIELNRAVKHNHLQTMFDSRTLQAIRENGIKLKQEFIQKLMQNYELNDEE